MPQRQVAEVAPHDESSSLALHADAAATVISTRQAESNSGQRASAAHERQALAAAAPQLPQRHQLLKQALRRRHAEQRVRLQTKREHGATAKDGAGGGGV